MSAAKITSSTTSTTPTPRRQRSTLPPLPPAAALAVNPHRLTLPALPSANAGASLNVRGRRQAPLQPVGKPAVRPPRPAPRGAAALHAALPGAPASGLTSPQPAPQVKRELEGAARRRTPRPCPAAPRPPLLLARSCALTALLPPAVRAILKEEIGKRLERHFAAPQWNYPIWLFRDSEILWGQRAQMLHAGRALRGLSLKGPLGKEYGLYWLLLYDAERLARLVVERHPEHTRHERVVCMLGALRRIGQIYREMRWRYGERRALWHVRNALGCLYWW